MRYLVMACALGDVERCEADNVFEAFQFVRELYLAGWRAITILPLLPSRP